MTGIPVVFVSALEGRGRTALMRQVISTYEKWCSRLPTARLNRWLRKVSADAFQHIFVSPSPVVEQVNLCSDDCFLALLGLAQVMSRHSCKDQAAQPKIKYFTQVKARPPTFVAFVSGKTKLSDTDLRFLTKSLKEDFDLGGMPVRIMQRSVLRNSGGSSTSSKSSQSARRAAERMTSDKRSFLT